MAVRRLLIFLVITFLCSVQVAHSQADGRYIATAYSVTGKTASGVYTQRHIVAADPTILPIGSIIKIKHAGRYSGEYVVADTGEKIAGRKLDIYIPDTRACKKFGKKRVRVQVVQLGEGTHEAAKQSVQQVKQDVKKDVKQGVAGNAATDQDLVKQNDANTAATQHSSPAKRPDSSNSPDHNPPK